ncbi:MAG: CsbD family protein [Bradyrhizobium sp.]|uniref:CsbD family protein n=1 Tax=Bradyrhizobium sp. TaxID=376 RepID=UPI001DCB831E|nr:CsbD family protein [Bradyrhizobium sp.]MBV9563467.1 CsbD family protein [Bradyrhizobium sp.]
MTRLQEKARGRTKQAVGQIIGDDRLVLEGKAEERNAEEKDTADAQDVRKENKKQ